MDQEADVSEEVEDLVGAGHWFAWIGAEYYHWSRCFNLWRQRVNSGKHLQLCCCHFLVRQRHRSSLLEIRILVSCWPLVCSCPWWCWTFSRRRMSQINSLGPSLNSKSHQDSWQHSYRLWCCLGLPRNCRRSDRESKLLMNKCLSFWRPAAIVLATQLECLTWRLHILINW